MECCWLFTYGTLMSSKVRDCLQYSPIETRPAKIKGYKSCRVERELYPAAVINEDSWLNGQLQLIPEVYLDKLDEYEGCHEREYQRVPGVAQTENGKVACQLYIKDEGLQGVITSGPEWSMDEFTEKHEDSYC